MSHYLKLELDGLIGQLWVWLQMGSLDGVWFWDLENPEHEWMSDRFWEVLGYDPATKKPLASEWMGIIHPDDLVVAQKNFNRYLKDPSYSYDQVVRYKAGDLRPVPGGWVYVRCRGVIIRDAATGSGTRMLGCHNDITELKLLELKLREDLRSMSDHLERLVERLGEMGLAGSDV